MFSCFDTIPAETDSQPATQPPSQTRCRSKDTAYYVARVKKNLVQNSRFKVRASVCHRVITIKQ